MHAHDARKVRMHSALCTALRQAGGREGLLGDNDGGSHMHDARVDGDVEVAKKRHQHRDNVTFLALFWFSSRGRDEREDAMQ